MLRFLLLLLFVLPGILAPQSGIKPTLPASEDKNLNQWTPRENESDVTQSCLTLCNLMECILPGSSVHGIFQVKVLEWVAIAFPGDLPNPGTELGSPALQADTLPSEPPGKDPGPPGKFHTILRPYSSVPIIHHFSETSKLLVEIFFIWLHQPYALPPS